MPFRFLCVQVCGAERLLVARGCVLYQHEYVGDKEGGQSQPHLCLCAAIHQTGVCVCLGCLIACVWAVFYISMSMWGIRKVDNMQSQPHLCLRAAIHQTGVCVCRLPCMCVGCVLYQHEYVGDKEGGQSQPHLCLRAAIHQTGVCVCLGRVCGLCSISA